MSAVEFQDITKVYGHARVLDGVTFGVDPKSFAVVFGPPGCGKSIVLRLLTGLEHPTSGRILLRGEDVTKASPAERNIGYVPQSFALYPHYKVYDNIAYPLKLMGASKEETDEVVNRAAEMLRITRLLGKRPDQLSGGEKQRVALARGIAKRTDIYVLDDPLAGLDFKLRERLFDDLKRLQESLEATFIYTTSDPLEALMLAEQILVMDKGRVIEQGRLEPVYLQPKQLRTMALLGYPRANLIPGVLARRDRQLWCQTKLVEFPVAGTAAADEQAVTVAIRPQDLVMNPEKTNGYKSIQAKIMLKEDLGGELVLDLDAGGTPLVAVVRQDDAHRLGEDAVNIGVSPSGMIVYDAERGHRIGQGAA